MSQDVSPRPETHCWTCCTHTGAVNSRTILGLKRVVGPLSFDTSYRVGLSGLCLPRFLKIGKIAPSYLLPDCHKHLSAPTRYGSPWSGLRLPRSIWRPHRAPRIVNRLLEELMSGRWLIEPARRKALDLRHLQARNADFREGGGGFISKWDQKSKSEWRFEAAHNAQQKTGGSPGGSCRCASLAEVGEEALLVAAPSASLWLGHKGSFSRQVGNWDPCQSEPSRQTRPTFTFIKRWCFGSTIFLIVYPYEGDPSSKPSTDIMRGPRATVERLDQPSAYFNSRVS